MDALQDALLAALDAVTPELPGLAERLSEDQDLQRAGDDRASEQFMRAFLALLREAIQGGGEQRDLVMQTAVPALVASGQTPEQLVHGHVAFFMVLQARMVAAVPGELRDDAALWLARYAAGYTAEVLEVAQRS